MSKPYTAQMSQYDGEWQVYVVLLNTYAMWPTYTFPAGIPVPTLAQRARALRELGFAPVAVREWEWSEASDAPDNPAAPVLLIASTTVEEVA